MIDDKLIHCIEYIFKKNISPFYIFDIDKIMKNAKRFKKTWHSYFPKLKIAYSYKTNSLKFLTQSFKSLGLDAEVVSGMELEWALTDGFIPNNIFFNGPVKSRQELKFAIKNGVNLHVDSLPELENIVKISAETSIRPNISFRLSVESGHYGVSKYDFKGLSRFGFTREEYLDGLEIIKKIDCKLKGIHLHIGSNINEPMAYKAVILSIRDIINIQIAKHGNLLYFDIGGGFAAASATAGQNIKLHKCKDFAEAIAQSLAEINIDRNKTTLIIEPGRTLVENFGYLVTTVISVKERNNKKLLIVNEGSHAVRSIGSFYHPVLVLDPNEKIIEKSAERYTILGSNCFEMDLLGESIISKEKAKVGNIVIIGSAGAYDILPANAWIRPAPPIFALYNNKITLIRASQSSEDIRSTHLDYDIQNIPIN